MKVETAMAKVKPIVTPVVFAAESEYVLPGFGRICGKHVAEVHVAPFNRDLVEFFAILPNECADLSLGCTLLSQACNHICELRINRVSNSLKSFAG